MLVLGVSDCLSRGGLESEESGGFSGGSTVGAGGGIESSDTSLICLVSVEVCLSGCSLSTSSSVSCVDKTGDV
jgi:hypothetical protein